MEVDLRELLDLTFGGSGGEEVNFGLLYQALMHMAVSLGDDKQKVLCHIDAETAAKLRRSDSGIERSVSDSDINEFGKNALKTEKSSTSLTSTSQVDVKKEHRESDLSKESAGKDQGTRDGKETLDDTQQATAETSSDKESASETKVKAGSKSEDESIQQDMQSTVQGMQEGWNYMRLNGRVEGLDRGLDEMSKLLDVVIEKLIDVRTVSEGTVDLAQELANELGSCKERTTKLEENVAVLSKGLNDSKDELKNKIESLEVSTNERLGSIKEEISANTSDINRKIEEVQETITPREDFSELSVRVDQFESVKVNREELGRFMEEGFIENFIKEHESLRTDLDALQIGVTDVNNDVEALKKRIDEEVMTYIDDSLEEVEKTLETMKTKLDSLDAGDINDTFAKLEDQTEKLGKDMEALQTLGNRTEKEAMVNSKKFSNFHDALNKLEASKIDKVKMHELLDLKADFEALMNKLDRSEFAAIMIEIDEKVKELTTKVEITEKNLEAGLSATHKQLSKKMYTEDFVPATEPIRNRIRALIYEQQKIKELVLNEFFPGDPGFAKDFSLKKAATLIHHIGNYQKGLKNPTRSKLANRSTQNDCETLKLPPIDINNLDSMPIPPADQPRTQDLFKFPGKKYPAIFDIARPQVGLAYPKRRAEIDRELAEYFGIAKEKRPIGGAHTKTLSNQRGLKFTTKTVPVVQKSKVLIEGEDKRIYRGIKKTPLNLHEDKGKTSEDEGSQRSEEQSYNYEAQKIVYPTDVVVHRGKAPLPTMEYEAAPK